MEPQPLFSLTEMTGREAVHTRTSVFMGVETPHRVLMLSLIGLGSGIPIALLVGLFTRSGWSLVLIPAWIVLILVLFQRRVARGMRVYTYQRLLARGRANHNRFILGSDLIDPLDTNSFTVVPGAVSNPALHRTPAELLAAERSPRDPIAAIFDQGDPR